MKPILRRILTVFFLFSIIIGLELQNDASATNETSSSIPEIQDAINNIRFYSSYHYQTLTEDKLNQLTVDFYLPADYNDVSITWSTDSNDLTISKTTESIDIHSLTGLVPIDVYHVTLEKLPSILHGEEPFQLTGQFTYQSNTQSIPYSGILVPTIPDSFFGGVLFTVVRYARLFLEGALLTLALAVTGTVVGFILALFIVAGKTLEPNQYDTKWMNAIKIGVQKLSSIYITIFRGTPMIVQASFFWYGLGLFGDAFLCGLFVVSINTAAYIAEILRGGIQSVDNGQTEAAKSLGMTRTKTLLLVVFPQAIRNSIPAIGNEFVINIKDTAVLSIIGIFELFNQTRKIAGMHYRQLEAYFVVGVIYLCLTYTVTWILKRIEQRMNLDLDPVEA